MNDSSCPFCAPPSERIFHAGPLTLGLWDGFPVSPGHALLVPKRHVSSWFEASLDEKTELIAAIDVARRAIEAVHRPEGFNIGVNVGTAGGQTVPHLHIHLIPRYEGDATDPRGGVRHVIPAKANYLATPLDPGALVEDRAFPPRVRDLPHTDPLVVGSRDPLLPHVLAHLDQARDADLAVAFIVRSGVGLIAPHLRELLERGGRLRIVTGTYLGVTEPDALFELLDIQEEFQSQMELWAIQADQESFHPKAYVFYGRSGEGIAFVGSSNLTRSGLTGGTEWNFRTVTSRDRAGFPAVERAFSALLDDPRARRVDAEWIDTYRKARMPEPKTAGVEPEPPLPLPKPHEVQAEALLALERTRAAGNTAGLIVLATGLGKTWLAAFDSNRPEYRRVLFVAHREEILRQALATFRRIRPDAHLGLYTGAEKAPGADVLFASIQTLGRSAHLERFDRDEFDYIVIDEFHHACASTYRRLIDYFEPAFLLGLTATPERNDGGDLLGLCQENLVFRCDLVEGVRKELLSPFHYFGIADEIDYRNIPWRSGRFDEEALTNAVATQARAQNALDQLRLHGGRRTLAFCCSVRHADFMRRYFMERGIRAAAVHSQSTSSDPRASSLEKLENGDLDVVFTVDMFNEGVDLPNVDTVLMLRPTGSQIVWLQQFGRGLRRAEGKRHLNVIDYVGNHRSFLLGLKALFALPEGDSHVREVLARIESHALHLPPGCEVTYELRAIDLLRSLVRPGGGDLVRALYEDFRERHGVRPTASELHREGGNISIARRSHGPWFRFVAAMGDLDATRDAVTREGRGAGFLEALETTPMTKSFKMLVLLAMLNADRFPGSISLQQLRDGVRRLAVRSAMLRREIGDRLDDDAALERLLRDNPVAAWTNPGSTGDFAYFEFTENELRTAFDVNPDQRESFCELVRELADWRLVQYLDRPAIIESGRAICKVNQSNGSPIVMPLERERNVFLPSGWTRIEADGEEYHANFVKIALNVVRPPNSSENVLPEILRRWFGDDAGLPETRHYVVFEEIDGRIRMSPARSTQEENSLQTGRLYRRAEIPEACGLVFNPAIWNKGFVPQGGRLFLLVTLEGSAYSNRFLSRDLFEWKSQNQTTQASAAGQSMRFHREKGTPVHLFVRKIRGHFVYCGELEFAEWAGDRPITVRWRLKEPLSDRAAGLLGVA